MISTPLKRLFAHILDGLIALIISLIAYVLLEIPFVFIPDHHNEIYSITLVFYVGIIMLSVVFVQLYFWTNSTSMGKKVLGMVVIDKNTHEKVGFWKMVVREIIGKWISSLIFGIGYIWILFDEKNQGWHDKLINSIVVEDR